jgi:hypothetical protein
MCDKIIAPAPSAANPFVDSSRKKLAFADLTGRKPKRTAIRCSAPRHARSNQRYRNAVPRLLRIDPGRRWEAAMDRLREAAMSDATD